LLKLKEKFILLFITFEGLKAWPGRQYPLSQLWDSRNNP